MKPLLLGPASRQLFGLLHEPAADCANNAHANVAALVCPPFGHEAMRSHRLFRVLGDRLARSGVTVLRFDYFGTGDSPGEDTDGELEGWRRDVGAAHEELRRRAPDARVVWLGARLGATLAVLAARSGRCDPARLVLWDPVIDGRSYLQALRASHVEALDRSYCIPDPAWHRQLERDPDAFTDALLGFGVSSKLLQQLRCLLPASLTLTAQHDTVVLADAGDSAAHDWAKEQLACHMPLELVAFKHPLVWTSDPHPNNAMVPADALQRLASAVHG